MTPTPKIFIGYRRDDSLYIERLWDKLVQELGEENVFFDVDKASIPPTSDFPDALHTGVQGAEIFLAVIGPGWISEKNLRRLQDEKDYVRCELKQALDRSAAGKTLQILPLLVGGASMPSPGQLPPELARFSTLQPHTLRRERTETYRSDIDNLITLINRHCPGLRAQRQNGWMLEALHAPEQSRARFAQNIAVRAPGLQPIKRLAAQSALDAWWRTWPTDHAAFVLLGEEGDGKSWATADWLADQLAAPGFAVPIVFAPALRMTSTSVTGILAACLEQSQPTPMDGWPARLHDLAKQPASAAPLFLLVIDSFNERTSLDWRELFDSIRASPWRERIALLCLCRTPYWAHLNMADAGLLTPWTLSPFDDAELEQALAQRSSTRGAFEPEVLHLMARPRYFDLAFRLAGEIEQGGLTLERLIYEDWRDMTSRKRRQACSHSDFQALITDLAKQNEDRRFASSSFVQNAQGITNDVPAFIKELESVRVLDNKSGKLVIAPRYLPLGLGLVLAAEVEESGETDLVALAEIIARRMGSYREADLQVRICAMALFHALNTKDYPEAGCLALLRAWIEGRNLDDSDLEKIAAYLPLRPPTYLHMAEYVWGDADNREAQDAFMVGFLRHKERPDVKCELIKAFTNWLGFVYPWGYRAYFEQDEEKLAESRKAVEERLGQVAEPGPVTLLGVQLEVVQNAGLLRLAQVALAVISHVHAKDYVNALLTGITASTVMDGSHAEFHWVLHICCPETQQALLQAARNLLAADQPIAYLAARKLLAYLGDEEARVMQASIPTEFRWVHPYAKLRADDPCGSPWGPWKENNYEVCLHRTNGNPCLIARQLKQLALNPDFYFPVVCRSKLEEAGNELDLNKAYLLMGNSAESLTLEEIEPALCAFAPHRYQSLMRALARTMATRDSLARRQLALHLLEYLPFLGDEERGIFLAAWRATLTLQDKHDKDAQLFMFPAVIFDLPAGEQMQRLIERGDENGYISHRGPCFCPLSPEHVPAMLTALKVVESASPQRLYNLLWYLSEALDHTNPHVKDYILTHFKAFDTIARSLCLKIVLKTGDADAANQLILSVWHTRDGREYAQENLWGSILLAESGQGLPFADLVSRISPEWLGYAVKKRGYQPEEVATYAALLDATWRGLASRLPPPEAESLSPYVVLQVNPEDERRIDSISIEKPGPNNTRIANYTWGGSAGAGSIKEIFRSSADIDAEIDKHNALRKQATSLAERERRNGNPWFADAFENGGLAQVLAVDDTLWRAWLAPVLQDDRRARQLLTLCRGFYEKLCAALLTHAPEQGLALFQAMALRPTLGITDARLGLPLLLMDAFAASASPEVEQLLRSHIDSGNTDLDLFDIALLCQQGDRQDWMRQLVTAWQQSDNDYDRARGLALLGFSNDEADAATLTDWIASHTDCWLRDLADIALQNHRCNVWARCWFDRFLSRSDRTEAWAAFRLFLRCVDRRFWLWLRSTVLADAEPWKRDALTLNIGAIYSACAENEKGWKDNFLGQKVKPKELWPWMGEYQ